MMNIKVKIPIYDKNNKVQTQIIEAKDIFEAIEIARKMKLNFVDDYTSICWYNGNNID